MDVLQRIREKVIAGDRGSTPDLVQRALTVGHDAHTIMDALVNDMDAVGEEWRVGNMFIPEVLTSAEAMHGGMDIIQPQLTASDTRLRGSVAIGTVQGDLHDIGKSLVSMMLQGAGFDVHDLGVNTSPEEFMEAVKTHEADIVAMSALLTTTLPYMRDTILVLEEAGLRDSVKVMVGGAPVTPEFADSIGADGYAPDGSTAVTKARELVGEPGQATRT